MLLLLRLHPACESCAAPCVWMQSWEGMSGEFGVEEEEEEEEEEETGCETMYRAHVLNSWALTLHAVFLQG